MSIERRDDPLAFRDFLDAKLSNGGAGLTLGECLDLWEYENQAESEREEVMEAIRRGLDDAAAGRTKPFDEFDREFRRRNNLPQRS